MAKATTFTEFSRRVFAECCSLSRVGIGNDTDATNDLAPGAQLGLFAFDFFFCTGGGAVCAERHNESANLLWSVIWYLPLYPVLL